MAGGVAPVAEAQSWSRLSALGSRLSALGSRLSALGSRLSALGSRLSALGSRLSALGSRLSALGSRLSALGSRLSALGSRLSALGSRLSALGSHNESQRTKPLLSSFFSIHPRLFPNPAPFRPENRAGLNKTSTALCRREGQYRAAVLNTGPHSSLSRDSLARWALCAQPQRSAMAAPSRCATGDPAFNPPDNRIGCCHTVPHMAVRKRIQPATVVRCNRYVNHINVLLSCDIYIEAIGAAGADKG